LSKQATNRRNKLICGDNLEVLPTLDPESVDLIYIDPPFFSNRNYAVVWHDEAEVQTFKDRWAGGIEVFIDWMRHRVRELHRVLKPTGSFYLHCDWHAGHYLKVMCDDIFGIGNFRNDIIWKRSQTRSSISKIYKHSHDVLLFYTKSSKYTFNIQYKPLSDGSMKTYNKQDKRGRYQAVPLLVSEKRNGETGKIWRGVDPNKHGKNGSHWITTPDKLDEYEKTGLVIWPKKSGGLPRLKYYLHENKGVPIGDLWDDIDLITSSSSEALGYPTQKPEELLARVINTSSNKGHIILDSFCGCGTSLAVAQILGRNWTGIDVSPSAVALVKKRLGSLGVNKTNTDISGMPMTPKDVKKMDPFDFQTWAVNELHGTVNARKVGDMGIDGYSFIEHHPIQVKQSEHVGRNVVDNFETALRRHYKTDKGIMKGAIIALSFGRGAREEVARAKREKIEIQLITVEEILKKSIDLTMRKRDGELFSKTK